MKFLPFLILLLIFVGLILFNRRSRERATLAAAGRREKLRAGSRVMTTSGLYGTVVTLHPDDTVLLSIAPGVEVTWALAALREADELPEQYRGAVGRQPEESSGA